MDEKLVQGNQVPIIGNFFQGAEGYITRIGGTKQFVLLIKGNAAVPITFVPRSFFENIESFIISTPFTPQVIITTRLLTKKLDG